jgi:predicted metalloprotease with PDZ domain
VFKVLEFESTKVPYRVLFSNPRIQMTERQVEADLNDLADAAARTFGSIPYSDYTFFVRVQPTSGSSSIGYRNSSRMTVGENDFVNQSSYRTFLTAAGISLVKAWYGRAARPASMQPYDFAREAYSRLFWFSEGVAAYSSDMLLLRSGLLTSIEYLARASVEVDSLQRLPGRLVTSLEESSWNTWTRSENGANTAVSYILKGKIAGMLLDAEIRGKTANAKSLDDVLRHLLRQADIRRAGLPEDGLESAVMAATGVNVRELLDAVTRGKGEIDYNRFLAPMGIQAATMKNPGTIYLGVDFERIEANQARIRRVVPGSPAEDAKLDGGDILLAMDSERVTFDNLASRLHSKPLGKSVSLLVLRGERLLTLSITPRMNETETWSVGEALSATPDQRRRRDAWLAGL